MSVVQVVKFVQHQKNGFAANLCALLFLLSPVLSNMAIFEKLSFGDFTIIATLIVCVLSTRKFDFNCFLGGVSLVVISLVAVFQYLNYYPEGVMVVVRMSFYMISFFIILSSFKSMKYSFAVKNIYLFMVLISSVLLIFQVFVYNVFDAVFVYIDTPIDIQPNSVLGLDIATQGFRSGGLFKEPSYFAIFVAPAMIYAASVRRSFLWLVICCATMLSTSALGFVFIMLSLTRFFNVRYLLFFSPIVIFCVGLVVSGIVPILPDRVIQTMNGEGSLSIRVIEPFLRVFVDGDMFLPNYSVLQDLADPDIAAGIWFNSISYAVVVFGVLAFIPIYFIFAVSGLNQFAFICVMLIAVNGLTNPFFLVSVVVLKVLDDIIKFSPDRRRKIVFF
ncbi:hypothetical protein GNF76_22990 [Pseudomonas sp. CCM 7893]|uniref:Uncharacterized protein n=1 Tax=Pseudomonas spelaei TaxID=1055469 RepID=A0A6I3WJ44_9PSED|nr:hypothetical protein [Pseudomonas spelaei]MUF07222.1 hypothetical protein [Pseudomonas spelaei]